MANRLCALLVPLRLAQQGAHWNARSGNRVSRGKREALALVRYDAEEGPTDRMSDSRRGQPAERRNTVRSG